MPSPAFFTELGLLVLPGFLDAASCARLRSACGSDSTRATVSRQGRDLVDEEVRRTRSAEVGESTAQEVEALFRELKPRLESHFELRLSGCEMANFLVYREDDFFIAHTDSSADAEASESVKKRKVSLVLFLNGQSEEADPGDGFAGGELVFYGLMDGPQWESIGLPLGGEEGMLVAFASDLLHEVRPVTRGVRHTVVSWFY